MAGNYGGNFRSGYQSQRRGGWGRGGNRFQRNSGGRYFENDRDDGRFENKHYRNRGQNFQNVREDSYNGASGSSWNQYNIPDRDREPYSKGSKVKKEKHPPGLRGREIGLWYAQRSQRGGAKGKKAVTPVLGMNRYEAEALNQAIDDISAPRNSFKHSRTAASFTPVKFPTKYECIKSENWDDKEETNSIDETNSSSISEVLKKIGDSEFKNAYRANIEGNKVRDEQNKVLIKKAEKFYCSLRKNPELDEKFYQELEDKQCSHRYKDMLKFRQKLPSYEMRKEILDLINNNQVVVLSGETGCGKTTQVAQFLLDDLISREEGSTCRIVCTQPRRISAISVAERVAQERAESLGESVGYQIRLESVLPRMQGSVVYCTTGIILQWLQGDPLLSRVSHLILDEIHERDSVSDFLICISKDLIKIRPDLKIVLMSATLNADQFSKYFENCPMIHIPGFTYNVKEYYLEDVLLFTGFRYPEAKRKWKQFGLKVQDEKVEQKEFEDYIIPHARFLRENGSYPESVTRELVKEESEQLCLELVLDLLKHIATKPPGAVLVFLPGWEQISKLNKLIEQDKFFYPSRYVVIPLHSLMPTVNQRQVFNRPPEGVRKIVIATNIAETSITIDDIVYVVDGGKIKFKRYDRKTNTATLLPEWVTLANAHQRRGRAGRVQEGICYHLYTKARENLLEPYPLPEIKRTRLEEVVLQVKILRLGLSNIFLSKIMDPPEEKVIEISVKLLQAINALDKEENLTPLGFHLARLPMDPLTGKMILMGAIFSCLSPILTVAASLSFKDPFIMVLGKEKIVDKCRSFHARGTKSDHLMLANVFQSWQDCNSSYRFANDNFLSVPILSQLKNMRGQFMDYLKDSKFVNTNNPEAREFNRNSDNESIVKAVITAGLYPNVAKINKKDSRKGKGMLASLYLNDWLKPKLHPKSINSEERFFEGSWLVYWEKVQTSKVFLYDTTMISNYPLLLFGQNLNYDPKEQVICVDALVKVHCDKQVADVIQKLRKELDELLEYKISHPGVTNWDQSSKEGRLLSLIVETLSSEKYETKTVSRNEDDDEDDYNMDYD